MGSFGGELRRAFFFGTILARKLKLNCGMTNTMLAQLRADLSLQFFVVFKTTDDDMHRRIVLDAVETPDMDMVNTVDIFNSEDVRPNFVGRNFGGAFSRKRSRIDFRLIKELVRIKSATAIERIGSRRENR